MVCYFEPKNDPSDVLEDTLLSPYLKNKFKLLLKDTNMVSKLIKDLPGNLSLGEMLSYVIRMVLKRKSEGIAEDRLLAHIGLLMKVNEYWIRFLLFEYFAAFVKDSIEEEIDFRRKLAGFQGIREELGTLLEANPRKILYPVNLVICQTILHAILDFSGKDFHENFAEIEVYLAKILDFSQKYLNLDAKTVFFIANSLIFNEAFKNIEQIPKELLQMYKEFLVKFSKVLKENDISDCKDNEILACQEGIRFKKSKEVFDVISRIFMDPMRLFSYENSTIPILCQLLFFSFEGQFLQY